MFPIQRWPFASTARASTSSFQRCPPSREQALPLVAVRYRLPRVVPPAVALPLDVPLRPEALDHVGGVAHHLNGHALRGSDQCFGYGPDLHALMRDPERRALSALNLGIA